MDDAEDDSNDAPMSSSFPRGGDLTEERTETEPETTEIENGTVVQSSADIVSDPTFQMVKKDSSQETKKKKKDKKHHMMPLQHARILVDIPESDEQILRNLFKKFTNSWSQFQKHPKLSKKYSVQNLKTLKLKVSKMEALYADRSKQKMLYKKFKAFTSEKSGLTRDEELKGFMDEIGDEELDRYTVRFYINSKFPVEKKVPVLLKPVEAAAPAIVQTPGIGGHFGPDFHKSLM